MSARDPGVAFAKRVQEAHNAGMRDMYLHCGHCGARFDALDWPRRCVSCGRMTFRNPAPVVVVLLPVDDDLLVVQRAIEPHRGKWVLPGGYIDFGESWQHAAARELHEETGVDVDPASAELLTAHSTPDGAQLLLFVRVQSVSRGELPPLEPRPEVSAIDLISGPTVLAFPLHTAMCERYFAGR